MQAKRIDTIQTSPELPVENLYNEAVNGLIQIHAQLAALPQDRSDPLQSLDGMLRDLGVERDNDASMFVMGAAGKLGIDAAMDTLGLASSGAAAAVGVGLDIASNMLMDASESRYQCARAASDPTMRILGGASLNRKDTKYRMTPNPAPKARPAMPATSIMRRSLERKKALEAKKAAPRRNALKKQMEIHKANIMELQAFKSCGVKYARRVTVPAGNGENETHLVASLDKPHAALTARGKPIDVSMCRKPGWSAPTLGMCA